MNQEYECRGTVARALAFTAGVLDGRPELARAMETYAVAATLTEDPEALAASALSEALKICGPEAVRARFGERIARLSGICPDGDAPEGWQKTRLRAVRKMTIADPPEQKLLLAIHLSALRALERGTDGARVHPTMLHWYHSSVAQALAPLSGTGAYREYRALIGRLFGGARDGK